jgi:hypothetical protein
MNGNYYYFLINKIDFPFVFSVAAGKKIYALTWAMQYINLFMINTGFIILAGQSLKVFKRLTTGTKPF